MGKGFKGKRGSSTCQAFILNLNVAFENFTCVLCLEHIQPFLFLSPLHFLWNVFFSHPHCRCMDLIKTFLERQTETRQTDRQIELEIWVNGDREVVNGDLDTRIPLETSPGKQGFTPQQLAFYFGTAGFDTVFLDGVKVVALLLVLSNVILLIYFCFQRQGLTMQPREV